MYRSAIELTISGLPQHFSGAINEKGWLFSAQLFCCIERRRVLNFVEGPFKNRHFLGRRISRREEESKAAGMNE